MSAFRDNAAAHRYEQDAPEGLSFADYRDVAGVRAIMHVETPAAAQGLGYASKLMGEIVAEARREGRKLRLRRRLSQAPSRHGGCTGLTRSAGGKSEAHHGLVWRTSLAARARVHGGDPGAWFGIVRDGAGAG